MYFNRFPGSYVGLGDAWKDEPWHSYALAFVWEKNQTGRSLIIYDVDAVLEEEAAVQGQDWNVRISPTHREFVSWCELISSTRIPINRIWYNQNIEHRGAEECLGRTLDWMRKMVLLGDDGMSAVDWAARLYCGMV